MPNAGTDGHRGAADILNEVIAGIACARLADLGATVTGVRDRTDRRCVVVDYIGRDAAGHAQARTVHIPDIEGADTEDIVLLVEARLAPQRRAAERAAGTPPVEPGPMMPLSHLLINPPLARRLRMDHGDHAARSLREAVLNLLEGRGAKLGRYPRPYGLVLNANRLDHRETLAPGVEWKGRTLVISQTALPQQVLDSLVGRSVDDVVEHHLLEGMTITRAYADLSGVNGSTTVLDVDGEWIRADRV